MLNLKIIPKSAWIYQFLNSSWEIIYIWKSINLFNRVWSYFKKKGKDWLPWSWANLNFAKKSMVWKIKEIKTIVVENERESLILETNLIKKHKPKYNILMKDDKNHLYIKITKEQFPKILKTRIKNNSWLYFWPYTNWWHVNLILKSIKSHFGYGIWKEHFFTRKNWYNLDKYLFNNNADINQYNSTIKDITLFLKWNYREIIDSLDKKMLEKAEKLEFEQAQKIKEQIEAIKSLDINQNISWKVEWNYHIVNFLNKFDKFFIWYLKIQNWIISWYYSYEIKSNLWESDKDLLINFIENKILFEEYQKDEKNINIISPISLKVNWTQVEVAKIGNKLDLLKMTYKNIYEYAYKNHIESLSVKWFSKKNMLNILNQLWYKQINKKIIFECNDISHISWSHTVASRSIIEDWKKNKSKYKKFKIKTLEEGKIDDFWSMSEITTRRIKELKNTEDYPDLIIIDWWKWQLSSVYKQFKEAWLESKVQLVSLAKKEEELFLPLTNESILLDRESSELRLIQSIRDEAHRFAITFNREKRIKEHKKNILESLPWFGPITRKKILNKYKSIDNLKNINLDELSNMLNKNQIIILQDHWIIK